MQVLRVQLEQLLPLVALRTQPDQQFFCPLHLRLARLDGLFQLLFFDDHLLEILVQLKHLFFYLFELLGLLVQQLLNRLQILLDLLQLHLHGVDLGPYFLIIIDRLNPVINVGCRLGLHFDLVVVELFIGEIGRSQLLKHTQLGLAHIVVDQSK